MGHQVKGGTPSHGPHKVMDTYPCSGMGHTNLSPAVTDSCCVHQGPRTPQPSPSMLMPTVCWPIHQPAHQNLDTPLFPAKGHFLLLVSGLTSHFTAELCSFAFKPNSGSSSLGSSSPLQSPSAFWSLPTSAAASGTCMHSETAPPCTHMHAFIHICARTHTCSHTHAHTYILNTCSYALIVHTYVHTHTHHTCSHTCTYMCSHT